jgi:hypothetical protein
MKTDFVIDGMLSGTGVRDTIVGGYIAPDAMGLSVQLVADITTWQRRYEEAHFAGFPANAVVALDDEGLDLASRVRSELSGKSVGYFSNGRMKQLA